jgi:predicted acetyltransferase
VKLVRPGPEHLAAYTAALQQGWSADNVRGAVAAQEELERIAAAPEDFLRWMEDIEARGPLVTLADGRQVPRLPGLRRWLWAEDADLTHLDPGMREAQRFIGAIGLRWARDHGALPPHVLGHCGYAVVPWHRGRGHATAALAALLPLARTHGLPFIELTTDPDNLASQQVMLRNGAVLVEPFDKGPTYGHAPGLRFRIALT